MDQFSSAPARNKQAGSRIAQGKLPIEVGRMSDNEADQLMRAMLEDDKITKEETSLLSSRVEHLPPALAQAASYVQENSISIGDYIKLLDESDPSFVDRLSEPFEAVGRDSETPRSLTETWIVSFKQIDRCNSLASEFLALMCLFHRQAIPKDFVTNYYNQTRLAETDRSEKAVTKVTKAVVRARKAFRVIRYFRQNAIPKNVAVDDCPRRWPEESVSPEAEVIEAIGVLKAFSFISEGKNQDLDMHRLVQLTMRKWLVSEQKITVYADWALFTVSDAYPPGEFENREVCLKYLPHARAVLEHRGTGSRDKLLDKAILFHNVGAYYTLLGQWMEAEQCSSTAAKLSKGIAVYMDQGRWKEAVELLLQDVTTAKRVLGTNKLSTLVYMNNLAILLYHQGQWKVAEELQLQVLEEERVLGATHLNTLSGKNNLVSIYHAQGRLKEAEELGLQTFEMTKGVFGAIHPHTIISMSNLVLIYHTQGQLKEAEELRLQTFEMRRRFLEQFTLTR
ncbi:hypothetical protein QQX98_005308 [Neonectria punicea]|uniref:Uncharacterized protein n=1 Tax=Neonectria punicea TaxID=979145 RepID=A0ABR1H5R0_9HYPO